MQTLLRCFEELCPGQGKIGKICKISGEKLFISPQISYIVLRLNAVKLCNLTAVVSGEITKSLRISPPLQGFEPLTSSMSCTSSSTAPCITCF